MKKKKNTVGAVGGGIIIYLDLRPRVATGGVDNDVLRHDLGRRPLPPEGLLAA